MFRLVQVVFIVFLFASPDVPQVSQLKPPGGAVSVSVAPSVLDVFLAVVQGPTGKNAGLRSASRLEIIRYVSGEFAHVVKPVPATKKGFRIEVGKPLDDKELNQELANHGAAANPGEMIQITQLEFRDKQIIVNINGGTKSHFRLRDHVQIGIGGAPTPTVQSTTTTRGGSPQRGAVLILDFGRALPDMSPDDVKHALAAFLDFSKERSAAVNWVDSLPPEYRKAITEKKAVVGMDHDMVLAALGRPDHKVRERDPKGSEIEDWIYGNPPSKTIFVTFAGDKVVRVREFN
ncbi:MAG: hypothetical protein WBC04_24095 [Candidatus Acidiferrales bacterium]